MTVVLAALVLLLAAALYVVWRWCREATSRVAEQSRLLRVQCQEMRKLRALLDALSIAGPPPAAVAALTPDAEPPIPAAWLDDLNTLPTTYDREYP